MLWLNFPPNTSKPKIQWHTIIWPWLSCNISIRELKRRKEDQKGHKGKYQRAIRVCLLEVQGWNDLQPEWGWGLLGSILWGGGGEGYWHLSCPSSSSMPPSPQGLQHMGGGMWTEPSTKPINPHCLWMPEITVEPSLFWWIITLLNSCSMMVTGGTNHVY